jgi:peptidoglycan-associated lipoprotein
MSSAANLNKESQMRIHLGTLSLSVVMLLMFVSGCAKSLQADAGGKSMEAPPPARTASKTSSVPSQQSLEPAPSLSGGVEASPRSRDDRTSDILVAKTEPSDAARRQTEDIRKEQAATTLAGLKDVYFAFDSWNITEDGRQALLGDAEWLRSNPRQAVTIEGHCDERGTQAYNLVLGEKRAKAVKNFLLELGVVKERLGIVSYGKDRPVCKESDESCYQQNRRGHLSLRVN